MGINKKHAGGSFEDFLKEEGIYEEVMKIVTKKRLSIQFERELKGKRVN